MNYRYYKKKNVDSVEASDVVFCGLLREPELLKKSIKDLVSFREKGLVNQIIFSTWIGEVQKNQEIYELFKKNNIALVESEEPKNRGVGNIWCQMKALDVGLQKVDNRRFVLKTRSDVYINPEFLNKIFRQRDIFKIKKDLPKGNIFSARVWVIWFEITRPFFMADECFYGRCEDLKKLVNYETCYDEEFFLGPGTAHVRRFINPFIKDYPILKKYLSNSNPDAKFRNFVQFFTEKVIDLRKVSLLRKIYDIRRFRRLNKQLKDPEYIEALATYYSILYSHFYIDGRSFPNQVIFRETSLPGVEMDPLNLENNFNKNKSRFKYGGQIYDYDEKLLNNIVEGKIEKTEFGKNIIGAIEKFYSQK